MKRNILILLFLISSGLSYAQESKNAIKMTSSYSSIDSELSDILRFEGIEYLKISFTGKELKDKSYHLSVKEIWDGVIKSDTTIINSAKISFQQLSKVNDTIFNLKVISKLTQENKLKMTFKFPRFSTTKEFDAIDSDDYSLRNVAEVSGEKIEYGKKFYLLAYILPYEKDGMKYWCAVESSGKEIESWGKEFGIKHYLVFEMIFE
ncbi:hypothetical protein DF185_07210 [Marinifilum breve]|uniref:Uncharacterized protein n=1 Tax=Marinifilum breve TaxID=2184082 RepID=A0A2V4A4Y6_9BACT|nr:hypothetical protein [Marinifilum breve]PXY02430.1 hypothetical protein DF185_07210 [Marinifilum breve]